MDFFNEKFEILKKTAKEYYQSGVEELSKNRNNSAVILFFKCILSLTDLFILKHKKITPSSHSERFRIAQQNFPEIYDILDKDFPFYQDSYNLIMSKELAEIIKNDAEKIAKKTEIDL